MPFASAIRSAAARGSALATRYAPVTRRDVAAIRKAEGRTGIPIDRDLSKFASVTRSRLPRADQTCSHLSSATSSPTWNACSPALAWRSSRPRRRDRGVLPGAVKLLRGGEEELGRVPKFLPSLGLLWTSFASSLLGNMATAMRPPRSSRPRFLATPSSVRNLGTRPSNSAAGRRWSWGTRGHIQTTSTPIHRTRSGSSAERCDVVRRFENGASKDYRPQGARPSREAPARWSPHPAGPS
jgi:hypothetical protein